MTELVATLMGRITRRILILAAAGLAFVIALTVTLVVVFSGGPTYHITARFTATPGLYVDNAVDVLGVPTGKVVSVTAHSTYVDVVMSLPAHVKIPASAQAVLMAPNPVSDRFVELTPPYTGGAVLAAGATIGQSNTFVPLELDQVYSSVDTLSKTLGPQGANSNGDLSSALHALAQLADGNGADVHNAIDSIAAALPALTAHPDDLSKLITALDQLTRSLAGRNATINALYGDLATATSQLAGERQTIASAVANLQRGVAEVADFIKANSDNITGSVKNLNATVAAVMQEQKALIDTFDTAPLGFQNFNRSIDLTSTCDTATGKPDNCPVLWGRFDVPSNIYALLSQYCGPTVTPSMVSIIAWNAGLSNASARETACGAELGAYQKRSGSAGAPNVPDLDLTHYLGS